MTKATKDIDKVKELIKKFSPYYEREKYLDFGTECEDFDATNKIHQAAYLSLMLSPPEYGELEEDDIYGSNAALVEQFDSVIWATINNANMKAAGKLLDTLPIDNAILLMDVLMGKRLQYKSKEDMKENLADWFNGSNQRILDLDEFL